MESSKAEAEPVWLDRTVGGRTISRPAVGLTLGGTLGAVTGAFVSALANAPVAPIAGGVVGGALGLAGSWFLKARRQEAFKNQQQMPRQLQQEYDLPEAPSLSFQQARLYQGRENWLVEFPCSGDLLVITNPGPKKPVTTVPEWDAGAWLNQFNGSIPETRIYLARPGEPAKGRYSNDLTDLLDSQVPSAKELMVTLEDGRLLFTHTSKPSLRATYDLNTGHIQTPHFEVEAGVVQQLEIPARYGSAPEASAYRYDEKAGRFHWALHGSHQVVALLPPDVFGPVRFPEVRGAGEMIQGRQALLKEEGVYLGAESYTKHRRLKLPKGTWIQEPEAQLIYQKDVASFAGGGQLVCERKFSQVPGGENRSIDQKLTLNGKKVKGKFFMDLSANGVKLYQVRAPQAPSSSKTLSQSVAKNGTIQIEIGTDSIWNQYTYSPDGSVKGLCYDYSDGHRSAWPLSKVELPKLRSNGQLVLTTGEVVGQVPLPPSEIGLSKQSQV